MAGRAPATLAVHMDIFLGAPRLVEVSMAISYPEVGLTPHNTPVPGVLMKGIGAVFFTAGCPS